MIDCHAHLDDFSHPVAILEKACQNGLTAVVGVGVDVASSLKILQQAQARNPIPVYPAIGLYPDEVSEEKIDLILELIKAYQDKLVALGEIGLDYWIKPLRKKQPGRAELKALQQKAFSLQLAQAQRLDLPVIVHSRGAWGDAFNMVKEHEIKKALFHWYSGPLDILRNIIKEGYLISATPATAYSPPLQAALAQAPLDRIVLETDCPVPRRQGDEFIPTSPSDLIFSLRALSELRGIDEVKLASITSATARRFFSLGGG